MLNLMTHHINLGWMQVSFVDIQRYLCFMKVDRNYRMLAYSFISYIHLSYHSDILMLCNKIVFVLFTVPASATNQFTWHPSGELHMSVGGGNSVSIDSRGKDAPNQEDVEVMSTDSSSSSSSDSQ